MAAQHHLELQRNIQRIILKTHEVVKISSRFLQRHYAYNAYLDGGFVADRAAGGFLKRKPGRSKAAARERLLIGGS